MFSGTILYFRYNIVLQVQSDVTWRSRHVTSRTMYQLPCYHPSMTAGSSCQGRSMDEYINIIWKLHGRWVCCNILPKCFVILFIAGEARERVWLLPHPGRAGVAGPGLRLVAFRGGAQTGQVLLTIYWNPVLIWYDYFSLFQETKEEKTIVFKP